MITKLIGNNIKHFREERKMSQKDLANFVSVTRPVISNWENGKSEPSSSQLVKLSKIFERPADEILGIATESKKIVVVDTSALMKRPRFLDELFEAFDEVVVPDIVISEINGLKDRGKPHLKRTASLVMNSINNQKGRITVSENTKDDGNNDEKIADAAIQRAKAKPNNHVYILSDDIYFQFLVKGVVNLNAITPTDYAEQFKDSDIDADPIKSIEFLALAKKGDLEALKLFDMQGVDVNFHNPDDGLTPLIAAVRARNISTLEYLLSLPSIDINKKDKHKYCFAPIQHAAQHKNFSMLKVLMEYGADIDIGSDGKNAGNTALMISAWGGFERGVDFFLENGACVNQQDTNGFTALFKACINSREKIIEQLSRVTDLNIRCRKNKKAADYINTKKVNIQNIKSLFKEQR